MKRLRILVVDDEASIRRVLVLYLQRCGHEVEEADSGHEALSRLTRDPNRYDVVLTDLRMPGLGGFDLFRILKARGNCLEQKLLFMSGDTARESTGRLAEGAGLQVLWKPFELADVLRLLEERTRDVAARGG